MNRSTTASLWACRAMALLMAAPAAAQILNLAPPGLRAYDGVDGDTQIGVSFTATTTFTIDSAGIKFNPFGNQTSQPNTDELDVFHLSGDGAAFQGPLLASGSLVHGGPCARTTLFPSNGNLT